MVVSPDDSEETLYLLRQVRAGEAHARDRLLERHRPYLHRLVELRLDPRVRARVDPSDVIQEAQMEAARRLDDYLREPVLPFRLWLRQIAYDRVLMLHRHHLEAIRRTAARDVRLPEDPSAAAGGLPPDPRPTPAEEALRRELARRVRLALAELAEGDREVILMRNFEGLSNREVARMLGIEPATASRRYGRALLRLRQFLADRGIEGLPS